MPSPVSERLRSQIEAAGISQQELARRLNKSRQAITMWKKGETEPSLETFAKLCRELGISADWVLGLSRDPEPRETWSAADEVREGPDAPGPVVEVLRAAVRADVVSLDQLRLAVLQLRREE